jgi:hypothetical protein
MKIPLGVAVLLLMITLLFTGSRCRAQVLDDWSFGTIPADGAIFGSPDDLIGWGYTLHNESTVNWLLAYNVTTNAPLEHGTASAGPFDYPALPPGALVYVPYNGSNGLYDLFWDVDAPAGFTNSGDFVMSSYWYDGDPFSGGRFVADAGLRTTNYRATVSGVPEVPETGEALALTVGLAVFLVHYLRNRKTRRQKAHTSVTAAERLSVATRLADCAGGDARSI